MNVTVISERPASARVNPGYSLRIRSIEEWISRSPGTFRSIAVTTAKVRQSPLSRLIDNASFGVKRRSSLRGSKITVWAALGTPQILIWTRVRRSESVTIIDVCDSVVRTLKSGVSRRDIVGIIKSLATAAIIFLQPRDAIISYISEQDAQADSRLIGGRRSFVLHQSPSASLSTLEPPKGPATRIVVPADLGSPHNRVAFQWLIAEIASGNATSLPPIEIYGPVEPALTLPRGVLYLGWAEDIVDVYSGSTVVFAPNIDPAGLQNKVLEALTASRRVVVGKRIADDLGDNELVFGFTGRADLVPTLAMACQPVTHSQAARRTLQVGESLEDVLKHVGE